MTFHVGRELMYMKTILLIVVLVFLVDFASGQRRDYFPGYLATSYGDTLNGLIKDRTFGTFPKKYSKIRFQEGNSRRRRKIPAHRISAYGYNGLHYEAVGLQESADFFVVRDNTSGVLKREFLRVIARNEKLVWYEREFIDDDSNYMDSYPLFYKPGSNQMVRVTQGILGLKKKRLSEYFNDCSELLRAIESDEIREAGQVYEYYLRNCN